MATNLEDRNLYRVWLRDNRNIFDVMALNFQEAVDIAVKNEPEILREWDIEKVEKISRDTVYKKSVAEG